MNIMNIPKIGPAGDLVLDRYTGYADGGKAQKGVLKKLNSSKYLLLCHPSSSVITDGLVLTICYYSVATTV